MAKEILIGDSDKANQKAFQKIFGTTGYHLVFSENGEDVLLRVKLFKPDLIIAGTALSEKNGYELCEAIKDDPDFRSIPFILLLDRSEKISDKDRERLKPDGILSKPLHESQVLTLVDQLLEAMRSKGGRIPGTKMELETFADMGEERFASSQTGGKEEEEEVIDLLDVVGDVVEEPESKMSIDDFIVPGKAEPFGEIPSWESWDILEKGGKIELPSEIEEPAERGFKVSKGEPAPIQEPEEKPFAFDEFEIALKKGVEVEVRRQEPPKEEALQPFSFEETKVEVTEEGIPLEIPIEEKVESIEEEEFPKDLLEDMLKEEELKEKGLGGEELEEEELEKEGLQEEELKEEKLFEEEELLEGGGPLEKKLREEGKPQEEETLEVVRGLKEEEKIELFEGLQAPEA